MLREAWRAFVSKHIVAHVPDETAACLDCGVVQCLNSKYETCSRPCGQTPNRPSCDPGPNVIGRGA
jgi:hypothetical protein